MRGDLGARKLISRNVMKNFDLAIHICLRLVCYSKENNCRNEQQLLSLDVSLTDEAKFA